MAQNPSPSPERFPTATTRQHGAVASTIEIQRADGGLRITVYDSTPVFPEQRSTRDEEPRSKATAIWFELQVLE